MSRTPPWRTDDKRGRVYVVKRSDGAYRAPWPDPPPVGRIGDWPVTVDAADMWTHDVDEAALLDADEAAALVRSMERAKDRERWPGERTYEAVRP